MGRSSAACTLLARLLVRFFRAQGVRRFSFYLGFGGGGVHGYNALEGTFLTGCIFSGRAAGLALAKREGSD
jgi:predicted oxidoreductase